MTEVITKDVTATVDAYFAMWNEEDTAKRAQHIEEAWADSGRYVDPARDAAGHGSVLSRQAWRGRHAGAKRVRAGLQPRPFSFPALSTTSSSSATAAH